MTTSTRPRTTGLPWQFYLAAAVGLAMAIGLLFLAFTLALFVLPVVLVIVLWQRWRWQRRMRAAQQQAARPGGKTVIEADYVVVRDQRSPQG